MNSPPEMPLSCSQSSSLMLSALFSLLYALASSISCIENCPLRFKSFQLNKTQLNSSELINKLITNYATQTVTQLYLVLGSLDALGNPIKLICKYMYYCTCLPQIFWISSFFCDFGSVLNQYFILLLVLRFCFLFHLLFIHI